MEKKGKEFDLGGIRVQYDVLVLARRVLMRQKRLLAIVAFLGLAFTIASYKLTPKTYTSTSHISIRIESLGEDYVRRMLNSAMRQINSNQEIMLIINELDLFRNTRATQPYEVALMQMRGELRIVRQTGSVSVQYDSKDPEQSRLIVAFVTERVLGNLALILDAPYARSLDALERALRELSPKVEAAQTKLFEFQGQHPEIAIDLPRLLGGDGPVRAIDTEITRAERDLRQCYAGRPVAQKRADTPGCRAVDALESELADLHDQYTASHPIVRAKEAELRKQEGVCADEQSAAIGTDSHSTPDQCRQGIVARLERLHREKVDIQKEGIHKPGLQREWAMLTFETNQLESQMRALTDRRSRTMEERLLAANSFEENFQLVEPARVPQLPSKPSRGQFAQIGMFSTALVGILLAVVREALRQTYLDPREFEEQTGLQVLAVLPEITTSESSDRARAT